MAFECQEGKKIGLENNLADFSDTFKNSKFSSVQITSSKNSDTVAFQCEKGISLSKANAISCLNERLLDHGRTINDLPAALISEILNCLDPKELGVVSCVSTNLYRLASEHQVWKEFYYERWGQPLGSVPLGPEYTDEKSWKELFVEKEFRSKTFLGRYSIDTLYGHTEAVKTVFVLASKKLVFTSGYDQIVRIWDMEEGLSISSSRAIGCTIRAVAADTGLLVAGGTDGFIQGWRAVEGNPHLFELRAQNQNMEFRIWEHEGPITCLALDFHRIYSGSWDMTVRIWDRSSLKCLKILMHSDWIWSIAPHDATVACTSGSDVYLWDTDSGMRLTVIKNAHVGNTYSLTRSHTGKLLFTGGDDGAIHMFEITRKVNCNVKKIAKWVPHTGPVYSLAFEFPWLVSASSDGKLSLIDVRKLLKTSRKSSNEKSSMVNSDETAVEPPQRMLHGFGPNLFSVDFGPDRIVCGGEEGVIRIWNFSQALEIEQRVRTLRGLRLENRMRRRKLQTEMSTRSGRSDQCLVAAAKKNQISGDRTSWHNRRRITGKLKA